VWAYREGAGESSSGFQFDDQTWPHRSGHDGSLVVYARSEGGFGAAEAFMRGDATPADLDTREKIDAELRRVLAGHDDFWPRWLVGTGVVK
jgi:hypothetical protein